MSQKFPPLLATVSKTGCRLERDRVLEFEPLEPRILFAADPVATVENLPSEEMVNEDVSFDVRFENNGDATGYKPYVDFTASPEMQITSVQVYGEAGNNPGGSSLTPIGEINSNGDLIQVGSISGANPNGIAVDHPEYAGNPALSFGTIGSNTAPVQYNVGANPNLVGQYVYSVSLPFGSYSEDNPPVTVNVTATINTADGVVPGQTLDVFSQGGFAYGQDALNNPLVDSPLVGALNQDMIDPQVIDLVKTASVPEMDGALTGENASGPNHPITYTLTVDVARLEDITGLVITDTLPDDLAYLGNLQVRDGSNTLLTAGVDYTINSQPNVTVDGISAVNAATDTLSITMIGNITGVAGNDIVVTYDAFVPYVESDGSTPVVDPISGDQGDLAADEYNDAAVSGTYDHPFPAILPVVVGDNGGPMNPGDPNGNTDFRIEEHSLAVQKSVAMVKDNNAAGLSPFDVLEYTMNFQLSDYFAVDNLIMTDVLGDGQEFLFGTGVDPDGIIPVLDFQMHGQSVSLAFNPGNVTPVFNAVTGETTITFNIYQQLIDSGFDRDGAGNLLTAGDALVGGMIPLNGLGAAAMGSFNTGTPTQGTVTFRVKVKDAYDGPVLGQQEISQGDSLGNDVTISARNLAVDNLAVIGAIQDDSSSATSSIGIGVLEKKVYSITDRLGNTTLIPDGTPPGNIQLSVGDVITYLLTYDLPLTEFENLVLDDFIPQPIFDASSIDDSQVYAFNGASYMTPGRISYGPADSFFGSQGSASGDGGIDDLPPAYLTPANPTIDKTLFAASNGVRITVGSYSVLTKDPIPTQIQFLVSVEVTDGIFADGLLFTNQVASTEANTSSEASTGETIAGSQVTAPGLVISKGVVATDKIGATFTAPKGPGGVTFNAPGSGTAFTGTINSAGLATTPVDSDITGLDGGDLVTFVIVVENLGAGQYGAYDVAVQDTLPSSFALSGSGVQNINLRVTDGAGNALAYTGDLFAGTFQLTDPSLNQGALERYDASNGKNLVVIAYDLVVDSDAEARSLITNTATLSNYAAKEGGIDYTQPEDLIDDASASVVEPQILKELVTTEITDTGNNAANQAVVGELVTYRVTLTLPEGTTVGAELVDQLDPGLAFVDILSVTASAGLAIPNTPGTGTNPANVTVGNFNGGTGNQLTFALGEIVNSNTSEAATETLVITYRAVVLDTNTLPSSPGNQSGTLLNNSATLSFTWTDDTVAATAGADSVTAASPDVTVVEPNLTVDKQASKDNVSYSNLLTGVDAGDTVYYRIRITNAAGAPTAFDTVLQDTLPGVLNGATIFSVSGGGFVATDFQLVGNVLSTFSPIDIAANTVVEVVVRGTLDVAVNPNQTIGNTANITWTSLDGALGQRSIHNTSSTERTGADGVGSDASTLDNYAANNSANIRIDVPVNSKSIVATSESFTSAPGGIERVAIGEIVRYRLQVRVPEGTLPNMQVVDDLRPGMVFINDGTAMVGFVSAANNLSSSTLGTAPDLGAAIGQPTHVLPGTAVSTSSTADNDNYNSATDVRFKLGDIVNSNTNNASAEYIIIEFNALVLNTFNPGNQSGTSIANSFQTRINSNVLVGANSNTVNVQVAEPNIVVGKTASTVGPVDAGDTFTYTITINNNSSGNNSAPAFDVRIQDVLDEIKAGNPTLELELVNPPTGILGGFVGNDVAIGGLGSTTVLNNASNNAGIDLTFNRINAGQTLTLTVTVRVVNGALAGAEIENTAKVSYTSLPGNSGTENATTATTYGTTDVDLNPGVDSVLANADANNGSINLGANAGERTGADVPNPTNNSAPANGAIRNNYAVAASAPAGLIIAMPSIDKTFQDGTISADDSTVATSSGADLVVGEQIIYDITVVLPEGVTKDVRVEDVLPAGLRIDSFSIITDGSVPLAPVAFGGTISTTPASSSLNGPGTLVMDFDDITVNVGAAAANANKFVIRVTATVTNVISNQQNITRANTARLVFSDPDRASNGADTPGDVTIADPTNNTTITVKEPTLAILKSVDSAAADAGDTLKYTITISNSSGQVAYDSKVQDILDANLNGATAVVLGTGFSATGFAPFTAPTATDFQIVQVTLGNIGEFTSAVNLGDWVLRVDPAFDLDIPDGASVTLDFQAAVTNSIVTGTNITNKSDVSWTSTDGANVDERSGASDPDPGSSQSGNLNNYAISSSIQTTVVNPVVVSKVVTATSDTDTAGLNVTIGEIVTYRVAVSLPEGTTPQLVLTDQLPTGMAFIPGSAVLTASRPGAPALNAAHPGTGTAAFNGTYNGGVLDTADMAITPAVAVDGTDIVFTFSDPFVVDGDNDVNNNTFYLTYQAVVTDNVATTGLLGSQDTLDNNVLYEAKDSGGTVTDSGTGLTDPAGKILTVIEPDLNAVKSVTVNGAGTSGDAGDPVVYSIVISHDANSLHDAFDLTFSDTLPTQIGDTATTALTMASVVVTHSVAGDISAQFEIVGGVLQTKSTADIDLAQTETLTVSVSGILRQSVPPGTSFNNQASFTYTNRDGDFTAPTYNPTPDITTDRERTVAENSNIVTVTVPSTLALTKTLIATSETGALDTTGNNLAIGETATYSLSVALEDGTTSVLTLTDTTPAGMRYVPGGVGSGVFFRSADGVGAVGFNSNTVYTNGDEIAAADLTDSTSDTVAGSLVFRFKDVIVPATIGIDTDTFQVEYTMRAVNVIGNQAVGARVNSAVVSADLDGDGNHTDPGETTGPETVTATIVEPVMSLVKAAVGAPASLANLDAGDTVQYTLTFENTGSSTAHDLLLTDTLPAGMTVQSIDSVVVTGGAIEDVAAAGTGTVNLSGEYTVPVGGKVVVTYTVVLDNTVTPGTNYTNGAQIVWTSLDGIDANERDGADGTQGGGTLNDYKLVDSITASTDTTFDLVKSVDKPTATIGEVLTYTLTLTLNEGTTNNVVLVDTLPVDSGVLQLEFLTGTETIAYGTAGTTISGSGTPVVSGGVNQTLTFSLGNVVLPANASADTITITYQVLVRNVLTNQAGDVETNTASGSATGVTPDTGNTTDVTLVEPDLTIAKVVTTPGTDAGDAVVYTLTITNASGANVSKAFDVRVRDILDSNLELINTNVGAGQGIVVTGATVDTNASTVAALDITLDEIAPGGTVTVVLNATLKSTVVSGTTVDNTASITYTSLDGPNANERDGDDGEGAGLDNYADSDSDDFIVATPSIDKLTPSDTTYAIGESVTWDILVTIPEGVTNDLVITDNLPAGIVYEGFQVITAAAGSGGLLANDYDGTVTAAPTVTNPSGNTRLFDFGQVTGNLDSNNLPANNTFLLRVTGRVDNILANQGAGSPAAATTFSNTASLTYTDGTSGSTVVTDPTVPGPVTAVEPIMTLDKTALTATTGLDAGDTIQYQVVFSNSGSSTAHDLMFSDTLPAGLTVQSIDSVTPAGLATIDTVVSGVGTGALSGEFTVPVGGSVTVVYTVVMDNTVNPGANYTNDVDIEWSSLNGASVNERDGDDGVQGDGSLNDYSLTDSVTVSTDTTFDLVKSVDKPTATIGEIVTYTLTLTLNEGTTQNVVLVDTLPTDTGILQFGFVPASETISYGTAGTTISGSATPVVSGAVNQTLTFSLGDVVLPAGASADTVTITYQVVVLNVLSNQAGDVETNSVDGSATGVTPDNNNTTDVTLVEPEVTATKTITAQPAEPDAGSTISYQIVLANTSSVTAYGVTFEDVLPAQMDIVSASFVATETVAGDRDGDFVVTNAAIDRIDHAGAGFDLAAGQTITITYDAMILPTVLDGQSLTNNVEVEWTSRPGNPTEERTGDGLGSTGDPLDNYEDRDSSTIVADIDPVYGFSKTILSTSAAHTGASGGTDPTIEDLAIGESVVYRLAVTMGNGTSLEVKIQDIINDANGLLDIRNVNITTGSNLTFSGPGVAVVTDPNADTFNEQLDIDFGTVVNDVSGANPEDSQFWIDITAVVVDVIENQAGDVVNNSATFSVLADLDNGGTPDDLLEITENVDVEIIEPVLDITKTVDNTQPQLGDTLTYTLLVTNQAGANRTDAFDIQIVDTLPTGLVMDTGSVSLNILGAPGNPSSIIANTSTATGVAVLLDRLDEGESVEIVYNVIVTSDITFFDAVLVNTVDMTYTSLPNGNGNINGDERGGTSDPADPDDYIDDAQESVEIFQPDVEIVKTIDAGGDVITPLEVFSYTLDVVSVGRADALNVVVTDDISYMLANGFVFVSADNGGVLIGGVVTWNLGDMQGNPVNDTAQVSFTMRAPRFLPAGFNVLPNTVEASHDDIDPTPENNIDRVQSTVKIPPRPIPPTPEPPINPPAPDPFGRLQFDLNQNFLFDRGNLAGPGDFWSLELTKHLEDPREETVQGGYIVSGLTQPGTSVRLVVYNDRGEVIGMQTTMADSGGNWLATFNSNKVGEIPARVEVQQTPAIQNAGNDSGYDLRTYFAPASSTGTYYSEKLTPENVMRKRRPEAVVDLYKAAASTIHLSWNGSSYEFATLGGQLNGSGN